MKIIIEGKSYGATLTEEDIINYRNKNPDLHNALWKLFWKHLATNIEGSDKCLIDIIFDINKDVDITNILNKFKNE